MGYIVITPIFAENVLGYTLCSVSLLTLTAISVDRLVALFLGLRLQTCYFFEWRYKYASFYKGEGEEVNKYQFPI